MWNREDLAYET